ncbi:hypothetical protein BZA05DRAFT_444329 [Tricharina praecox]|uniref:uncharacterized protein n=1 Tax=Tricharina praecox TaxID=43433 RepID=UPI002220401E|nr:uncharacterized protein BZA05DRAFT_444329 [Tricharina praecox]KAI5853304.1 hypothetical protein BZA05DRAFT_444329 [Tricharina praecox]
MAFVICSMRLVVRYFVVHRFGIDDVMIMNSLFAALTIATTYHGVGEHLWNVSSRTLQTLFKIYFAALCSYLYVALSVKISLLVFLMRHFPDAIIQKTGRGLVVFLVVFTITGQLPLTFQCSPVRAMWEPVEGARCLGKNTLFAITVYQAVVMFVTDAIILVLPLRPLWRLKVPLRERIPLIGLFGLGTIACAASLIRFTTLAYTKDEVDFTYSVAKSGIWMNVEFSFALMAGSLPSLRVIPGIRRLAGYLSRDAENSGDTGTVVEAYVRKPRGRQRGFATRELESGSRQTEGRRSPLGGEEMVPLSGRRGSN